MRCKETSCKRRSALLGYCDDHWKLGFFSETRNYFIADEAILPAACDHSTSRCECINEGKPNYHAYLKDS